MRILRLLSVIAMATLVPVAPAIAQAKLVASERINGEGVAFQSRKFGQLRLVKISVRDDNRPKCMVSLDGVEAVLAEAQRAKSLVPRRMPGGNGVIITIYLKFNSTPSVPTCDRPGEDCQLDIVVKDAKSLLGSI
ncbi:hypothetical protein [Mesorhizobium sp. CAU 1741]|uniref:hypothetical protein n=1 Tax=Mesorhizobium sp. CAU 1741 TaxID=3140366 RepID=UPI00325A9A25